MSQSKIMEKYIQTCGTGGNDPVYTRAVSADDQVVIPFVEVKIWHVEVTEGQTPEWFKSPDSYLRVTELESLEINKTYKKIFQTATFTIPRGTIVSCHGKQISAESKCYIDVEYEGQTGQVLESTWDKETQNGDAITPGTYFDTDTGESTLPVNASKSDDGVLAIKRKSTDRFVNANDIKPGNRIEIRMAYAYSDEEYREYKLGAKKGGKDGTPVFSGIVHKCSINSPLVVECEDMMSIMKKIPCPNLVAKKNYTVNDFLSDTGDFHLIKNSGIKLDTDTEKANISVGKVGLTKNNVVADFLDEWAKCGLYAFMNETTDPPTLRVGRVYTSKYSNTEKTVSNLVTVNGGVNVIQFDWDVANDNLKAQNIDFNFLAVEAHAMTVDGKYWKLTVRPNPSYNGKTDTVQYLVNNVKIPKTKKQMKAKKDRTANLSGTKSDPPPTLGLDTYSVVPYFASKIGITQKELEEEAWAYLRKYKGNGISGSLTLFGDRTIRPTDTVALIDPRHPERNGYYFVEESNIKFSVSDGYRVEIKIPYKLGGFQNNIKTI